MVWNTTSSWSLVKWNFSPSDYYCSAKDSIKHALCSAFMIEVCSKVKVKWDGNFKVSGSFDTSSYDHFVVIHIIVINSSCKTYSKSPQENWSNVTDSWYWKLRLTVPLFFKFVIKLLGTPQEQCQEIRGLRKFIDPSWIRCRLRWLCLWLHNVGKALQGKILPTTQARVLDKAFL